MEGEGKERGRGVEILGYFDYILEWVEKKQSKELSGMYDFDSVWVLDAILRLWF